MSSSSLYHVSADVPAGLLQVFVVRLGNLLFGLGNLLVVIGSHHGTLNLTLYSIDDGILAYIGKDFMLDVSLAHTEYDISLYCCRTFLDALHGGILFSFR